MKAKAIVIGPAGLRAGWRLLLFVIGMWLVAQGLFWIVTDVLKYKFQKGWHPGDFAVEGALDVLVLLAASFATSRIERKSFADYGLSMQGRFGAQFFRGIVWGFLASTAVLLIICAAGGASIEGAALPAKELALAALAWLPAWLLLGFFEEFFYRGYPLAVLCPSMGFWPVSLLYSAIFGALHYFFKPMESWMDAVSVALFGLFWCFTLRRTGSLWFAIGFHAMSDYADLVIYAAPNTGNNGQSLSGHLLNVQYHGPAWLTGGVCGMEASAVSFLALAALFFLFHRLYPRVKFPIANAGPD